MRKQKKEISVILHDVRSIHNVGSVFRTADAAGVEKIYLTGYTPAPIDRFGRARKDLSKVSLGAEKSVPWESFLQILLPIKKLKKEGVRIVAVEQAPSSINYKKLKLSVKTAFIFGNEVEGLTEDILRASDVVGEIPMTGEKESLNVSVAAGIILFNVRD